MPKLSSGFVIGSKSHSSPPLFHEEIDFQKTSCWGISNFPVWGMVMMIRTWWRVLPEGVSKTVQFQFFDVQMHFPLIRQPWCDIKLLWKKIQLNFWSEIKSYGVYRNMKECIREVNPEGLGWLIDICLVAIL